jgi:hypothetical protein
MDGKKQKERRSTTTTSKHDTKTSLKESEGCKSKCDRHVNRTRGGSGGERRGKTKVKL